jgi:hypothetical protein
MTTPTRFTLTESSDSLWRVTFNNPPLNLIDSAMISELDALFSRIESSDTVAVVVFDSADPDFFLAHIDIVEIANRDTEAKQVGTPPGQPHPWLTSLARLNTLPAVTISSIRGRARGAGSEFVIATDLRFASREKAVLGQFEIGVGAIPRWWTCVKTACTGRAGTRARDPLRWLRFRWRPRRTIWLRQPRLARRRTRRTDGHILGRHTSASSGQHARTTVCRRASTARRRRVQPRHMDRQTIAHCHKLMPPLVTTLGRHQVRVRIAC